MSKIIITSQLPDCPDARRVRTELIADGTLENEIEIINYHDLEDGIPDDCEVMIVIMSNGWNSEASIDMTISLAGVNGCRVIGVWSCDIQANAQVPEVLVNIASSWIHVGNEHLPAVCDDEIKWVRSDGSETTETEFRRVVCKTGQVI